MAATPLCYLASALTISFRLIVRIHMLAGRGPPQLCVTPPALSIPQPQMHAYSPASAFSYISATLHLPLPFQPQTNKLPPPPIHPHVSVAHPQCPGLQCEFQVPPPPPPSLVSGFWFG